MDEGIIFGVDLTIIWVVAVVMSISLSYRLGLGLDQDVVLNLELEKGNGWGLEAENFTPGEAGEGEKRTDSQ